MSLHDKLLPWRCKRSGTSLARICVRNALQVGEQLPYSRVRFVVVVALLEKMIFVSGTELVHSDFETHCFVFLNCKCCPLLLLPYFHKARKDAE